MPLNIASNSDGHLSRVTLKQGFDRDRDIFLVFYLFLYRTFRAIRHFDRARSPKSDNQIRDDNISD